MRLKPVFANLGLVVGIIVTFLFVGLAGNYVSAGNPPSFDWRNKDSQNWMTLVKDQGICGSCWAFSAVGTVEAVHNIRNGIPNPTFDLSEEELISDCLLYSNCCGGSNTAALEYIRDKGIVDETCFPYADGATCTCPGGNCTNCTYSGSNQCSNKKCTDKCPNPGDTYFIRATADITEDSALIKEFLVSRGPLSAAMRMAWPDCGFDGNGIYRCYPGFDFPPNHDVIIVGYDDAGGYWIVKNSWGSDWGPDGNGYLKVGYGEASIETDTSFANTEIDCGAIISENETLTDDIINCSAGDHALIIDTDDVVLDCDSHLIDGFNTSVTTAGVYLFDREIFKIVTGATVKNCNIQEFAVGIYMYGGTFNNLISNNLKSNNYGVYFHTDDPILYPNSNNTITGNSFIGNNNNGVVLAYYVHHNTIWDNIFIDNGSGGYYDGNALEGWGEDPPVDNNWDYLVSGESIGNYWDDFVGHEGWPYTYVINGSGDGIDHDPVGGAGYLCSVDADCASGLFCAGSKNNSSRCGLNPTPDGWDGGGDTPGCGTDPDSKYLDYYFDVNGYEQYEVTDTKNCDIGDDCVPPEIMDWFVMENTNVCDSKSWYEGDLNIPQLQTPADGYEYKVCDNLNFTWQAGQGGSPPGNKYYFNAKRNGVYYVKDLPWTGTQLFLDWKFVENEADDGTWEWWVCNGQNGYQCSGYRTIVKDTTPTLIQPDGETVNGGYKFDWDSVLNAKNYVVKLTGNIAGFQFTSWNPLYLSMGPLVDHILTTDEYKLLTGNNYTWALAAVCNAIPTASEMKKYEYSDSLDFYK